VEHFHSCGISKEVSLLVASPRPAITDPILVGKIEEIWARERLLRPNLNNGSLLEYQSHTETEIRCAWTQYKYYVAQRLDSEIESALGIAPLAVSGITRVSESVLFGERSRELTQYPGYLELVPSGGIEGDGNRTRPDFLRQILVELTEETGIPETEVQRLSPFVLVHDLRENCWDIGVEIDLLPQSLARVSVFSGNSEYVRIQPVPIKGLDDFLEKQSPRLVPTSLALLHAREWV
jgi:hypothetical protein